MHHPDITGSSQSLYFHKRFRQFMLSEVNTVLDQWPTSNSGHSKSRDEIYCSYYTVLDCGDMVTWLLPSLYPLSSPLYIHHLEHSMMRHYHKLKKAIEQLDFFTQNEWQVCLNLNQHQLVIFVWNVYVRHLYILSLASVLGYHLWGESLEPRLISSGCFTASSRASRVLRCLHASSSK